MSDTPTLDARILLDSIRNGAVSVKSAERFCLEAPGCIDGLLACIAEGEASEAALSKTIVALSSRLAAIQSWRLSAALTPGQDAALMALASRGVSSSSVVNALLDNELRSTLGIEGTTNG